MLEFENGGVESGTVVGSPEIGDVVIEETATGITSRQPTSHAIKALPAARILAKRLNIALETITPSGAQGQITVEDVEKAAQDNPTLQTGYEPLHGVRRTMAISMVQSHREVVPVTLNDDAHLENLPREGDITLAVIQAILMACKAEPSLNAWFDGKALARRLSDEIHLGLAIDSVEGLFVPVLKNVLQMSPQTIREQINRFKEEVKNRTITAEDMRGATFVLSNFGTFSGRYASPIILPPCVAILGVGRLREQAIVKNGQILMQNTLPLSLTFDHRAVTGGEASRFLAAVIATLEG